MVAEVVLRDGVWQTNKIFDYLVPEELTDKVCAGQYVRVPFGKGNRAEVALILKIKESSDSKYTLKKIASLVEEEPVLNEEQLQLLAYLKTPCRSSHFFVDFATVTKSRRTGCTLRDCCGCTLGSAPYVIVRC